MLYWVSSTPKMVIARFEFKPEHAASFIEGAAQGQNVIEVAFDSAVELVQTMREFEEYLIDCTAIVNGKVMALSSFGVH